MRRSVGGHEMQPSSDGGDMGIRFSVGKHATRPPYDIIKKGIARSVGGHDTHPSADGGDMGVTRSVGGHAIQLPDGGDNGIRRRMGGHAT